MFSEPRQTSKIEILRKIAKRIHTLNIYVKISILEVWLSSKYASGSVVNQPLAPHESGIRNSKKDCK